MDFCKNRAMHITLLMLYPIIASLLSFQFHLNTLWAVGLFLVVPSIHLSFLKPKIIKKALLFALPTTILLFAPIGHIASRSGQWFSFETVFPRVFEFVAVEELLWGFFLIYAVVLFYEFFVDREYEQFIWGKRMKYLLSFFSFVFAIFVSIYYLSPELLVIPFFYLWLGLLFVLLPLILELVRKPRLAGKFFITGAYFFFLSFLYQITAIKLNWWGYTSEFFVGWVEILGVRFPFEEFFFWFVLLAMSVLAYYEFFDDDEK